MVLASKVRTKRRRQRKIKRLVALVILLVVGVGGPLLYWKRTRETLAATKVGDIFVKAIAGRDVDMARSVMSDALRSLDDRETLFRKRALLKRKVGLIEEFRLREIDLNLMMSAARSTHDFAARRANGEVRLYLVREASGWAVHQYYFFVPNWQKL